MPRYRYSPVMDRIKTLSVFVAFVCLLSVIQIREADAQAYPNGAWAYGTVTSTWTMNQMFRFTISGTRDDGSSGTTDFWIDTTTTGGASRVANILAAAAAGKTLAVWNYGQTEDFYGQAAYASGSENVSW